MHIFSILDDKLFGENHWCARNVYFLWFYLYPFCGDSLQTGARNSWKILQRLSSCQKSSRKRNNIPIASTSSLMKKELTNQNWVSWLFLLKSNGPYLRPSKSSQNPVVVMKFEFCAHSAKLLRKLDHVFLWILSNNTGLWQCSIEKSKENFND